MPRKIPVGITFDDAEDEILFTRAALRADPDAEDLLGLTDGWMAAVDGARQKERAAREALLNADARRTVANGRLDVACTAFGDDLWLAVGRDRTAARWRQFFAQSVSRFIRQALSRQVATVQSWLGATDPALSPHRTTLERWAQAAADALVATRGTALVRGESWQAREEMADELTRERDGLWMALASRARERGLPRDWPDLFFRVEARKVGPVGESGPPSNGEGPPTPPASSSPGSAAPLGPPAP